MKWHRFNFKYQISNFRSEISDFRARRGFSLVEVLLAIFILGIGMIMVASVFPVGANWTRQTAETSVAQNVAQNAVTVIKQHYGVNGDLRDYLSPEYFTMVAGVPTPIPTAKNDVLKATGQIMIGSTPFPITPFVVQPLPGFQRIPITERGYLFGSPEPFPVPANRIAACTYYWSALIRLNPAHRRVDVGANQTNLVQPSSSYNYDLFILVFHKGSVEQTFNNTSDSVPASSYGVASLQTVLDTTGTPQFVPQMPSVAYAEYGRGQFDANRTPSVYNAYPPMGQFGIGASSGTVFRQTLDMVNFTASPRPFLAGQTTPPVNANNAPSEPIIFAPAADGTANTASPLVYIYQTTLSF